MTRSGVRDRRRGRAFSPELAPTVRRVRGLLRSAAPGLRRWLALNLARLTVAMLQLWRGARSGHGYLTLSALSRAVPLDEREKSRSKRLARLLRNRHLVGSAPTPLLVRLALGRVPHRQGEAIRYPQALYHATQREPVDLIIFRDPAFREPWCLLVPPGSHRQLPTARVVALYRQRIHIELNFRDWKTHLGIRGLRLEVDIAPRLERRLLALTVAYTLAVLLGAGPAARRVRADCEVLRSTPRHGTRRRLSALTVGILLSLTRFGALAMRALTRLLAALARGTPATTLAVCPP